MAVFPSQTLRDLIQNNIDYVAKQVGVINDFLFGETSDGTDDIPQMPYILHTCQLFSVNPKTMFDININNTQYAVANVDLDAEGLHIRCFDTVRNNPGSYPDFTPIDNIVLPYMSAYSSDISLDSMGVDYLYNESQFIYGSKNNSRVSPVYADYAFNDINGHQELRLALTPQQTFSLRGSDPYIYVNASNILAGFFSDRFYFQQLDNNNYPSRMVVMPNPQSKYTYTYIDNSTKQTINYNGDTIYNYYNDSGDIIINGGGVGGGGAVISPVGGLAYADVKFILDSLVDELNLHFDFAGDGVEPLSPAPTLDELRYNDQGSFYITPIKQIDNLPLAPDIADTVIDVSEPLGMLSSGFGALLSVFDSLGVTLTLTFTFLACLVINKLRGD